MPQARNSRIPPSGTGGRAAVDKGPGSVPQKPYWPRKQANSGRRLHRRILAIVAAAGLLFGVLLLWLGVSSANAAPAALASFGVTPHNEDLRVNFQLTNSEGELVSAAGSGTIEFYDGLGNSLARQQISFTKEDFDDSSMTCSIRIPKATLDSESSVNRDQPFAAALTQAGPALSRGRAILTVAAHNSEATLGAVCEDIEFHSAEEAARISRKAYFDQDIQVLEEEINEQWPFAVRITDYAMIGDHGWAVAGRSGNEIIFYYYSEIYDWYLLETEDGGRNWDIAWGGDTAPLFTVDITGESTLEVTTPSEVFHANFQGEKAVYFVDPNLERAIREATGVTEGPIYPSDLEGLTSLSAVNQNVIDLTGLEHCTNLESLELQQNQIHDVSPLAGLTGLTTLRLSENQISDIEPLANLIGLEHLHLSGNGISDISPLADLPNLAVLMLLDNQIRDISALVDNPALGEGDSVGLTDNPLSKASLTTYLPDLRGRGVDVIWPVTAPSVETNPG